MVLSIYSFKIVKTKQDLGQIVMVGYTANVILLIVSEFGGSNIRDSVASRDSGLGIESGSIDNLANGINSMGLGGRGFPAYGNQGRKSQTIFFFNIFPRISWRRIGRISKQFWWNTWLWSNASKWRLCKSHLKVKENCLQ